MTIKITYAALHSVYNGEYYWYATRIERRFGGDGFELNEATIQFFIDDGYCVGGGGVALFGVLAGDKQGEWEAPYRAWERDPTRPQREPLTSNRELQYVRWKHLFAALERYASSKQIGEGMATAAAVTNGAPKRVRVITAADLERLGACAGSIRQFSEIFGESAEVTEENASKAVDAGLAVSWLGRHALTSDRRAVYNEESREAIRRCPANESNDICQCDLLCALIFVRLYNEDAPAAAPAAQEATAAV